MLCFVYACVRRLCQLNESDWDPLPKRIINAITINGVIEYLVQFADGTQTMVSFTCEPMRQLMEQFEKDRIYRSVVKLNRLSELDIQNIWSASASVNTRPKRKAAIATTTQNVDHDANHQTVVRLSRLSESDIRNANANARVIRPPPSAPVLRFAEQNEPSTSRGLTSAPKRTTRSNSVRPPPANITQRSVSIDRQPKLKQKVKTAAPKKPKLKSASFTIKRCLRKTVKDQNDNVKERFLNQIVVDVIKLTIIDALASGFIHYLFNKVMDNWTDAEIFEFLNKTDRGLKNSSEMMKMFRELFQSVLFQNIDEGWSKMAQYAPEHREMMMMRDHHVDCRARR